MAIILTLALALICNPAALATLPNGQLTARSRELPINLITPKCGYYCYFNDSLAIIEPSEIHHNRFHIEYIHY